MTWKRLKRIFDPKTDIKSPEYSFGANPYCVPNDETGLWVIYHNQRGHDQRSVISHFSVDPEDSFRIVDVSPNPIILPGALGSFDDRGCSLGCIVNHANSERIYYLGWNLSVDVPFRNAIGLACAQFQDRFVKKYKGPILDRSRHDPFSVSYPFVMYQDGIWKMWYGSHKKWGKSTDDMIHVLKYAESSNGIDWITSDRICIDSNQRDYAFSRPFVIYENNTFKMWYSYRGIKYRIGYAESPDGLKWTRIDGQFGLEPSGAEWENEMVCYPNIVDDRGERFMLYNGNGYGASGIGVAKWIE